MPRAFKVGELLDVEVEKLSFGSAGLARIDGFVLFIPFSAPEDLLQVQITLLKPKYGEAKIVKILKPSKHRAKPLCPVYERCGGCDWQHLDYQTQLREKHRIVEDFLKRSVGGELHLSAIEPSPQPFGYRNRVQLKYQDGAFGFFAKNTHEIVDIDHCPLMEPALSEQIPVIKKQLQKQPSKDLKRVEIQILKNGQVHNSMENVSADGEGFSQVNRSQNDLLIKTLLSWTESKNFPLFLDLYAGAGNFTFPMLERSSKAQFIGVELHAKSVQKAHEELKIRGLSPKKAEFYVAPVEVFLQRFKIPAETVVLIDPPRAGCDPFAIRALADSLAQTILYISCDPASLARDLKWLFERQLGKWKVTQAKSFDMFPQTHHVETLVEITRVQS